MSRSRTSPWIIVALFAVAAAIVFHAWWPTYRQSEQSAHRDDAARLESKSSIPNPEPSMRATKDDILAACVEISATRKMDGARRIRILRDIGVPADRLESVNTFLELSFMIGSDPNKCAAHLEKVLREE